MISNFITEACFFYPNLSPFMGQLTSLAHGSRMIFEIAPV